MVTRRALLVAQWHRGSGARLRPEHTQQKAQNNETAKTACPWVPKVGGGRGVRAERQAESCGPPSIRSLRVRRNVPARL